MRPVRLVLALLLFLVGLLWIGQGIGIVTGSAMTGSSFWAIAGVIVVAVALALAWTGTRGRPEART